MTDQWLLEHFIRRGLVTESSVSRHARMRLCPRGCKAWVLIGLDGHTCAIEARCDPQPLSALGEALALLEGRYTEALRREGGKFVLDPRMPLDVRARPAGSAPREDVLRQHRCHDLAPPSVQSVPTVFASPTPAPTSDQPPF